MVVIDTSTDDGSSTQVGSQTRLRKYWQQTLSAPKARSHTWSSFLSRNGSVLILALMASGMIAWTSYYSFLHTNHPRELQNVDGNGGGQSVFVLQVSVSVTALLLSELASACYERVRWQQASSPSGVLGGSLIGLSRGTSLAGVMLLLVHPASQLSTRLWCLNRILTYIMVFLIMFVLLLGLSFPTLDFVEVDFDKSLVVTTGWGDFNVSAVQQDVLGYNGFLTSSGETLRFPSSRSLCSNDGSADTTLDRCDSHLLFTGLSNIQTRDGDDFKPLVHSRSFRTQAASAAGFMPWVESPWAVSFYKYIFNYPFQDFECPIFFTPSLPTSMDDADDWGLGNAATATSSSPGGSNDSVVGVKICIAALEDAPSFISGQHSTNGTTIVMQASVCIEDECVADGWQEKRGLPGRPPGHIMFHGPMNGTPLMLSMTITKWYATPVYSTKNGEVVSADLPVYTIAGVDRTSVLQTLGITTTNNDPSNDGSHIPVSINGTDFRNFFLRPFLDNGNDTERYTLPNLLLNEIVGAFMLDDPDAAYALMKDLLAYSLRESSTPPSSEIPNETPSLWSWQQTRMQISLPAFYLFVALSSAVALNSIIIFVWTSITDRASSTTLYPEVDFGAGFMSGHSHDNRYERNNRSHTNDGTLVGSSSSQGYENLPGYESDPAPALIPVGSNGLDRRNMSQEDFMTRTQEQIDLVSKLRRVDSGRVVHRMAKATFKVADLS
ncbi:hypothetical protein D9758_010780 [Tetrapyrgos nigripes]|uniref:Transmembrane protein n=1 Tax=Tetrapyrgos nigripes TaxID=182062 RepID=A0A8H5D6E1_9AGAR|nr:hypothetical protein D9758_010780 [Tetrapyrgos nigripes]